MLDVVLCYDFLDHNGLCENELFYLLCISPSSCFT